MTNSKLSRRTFCGALPALAVLPALHAGRAHAQAWPEKPIRFICPFPAGGTADQIARMLADRVGATIGQPLVVDNRTGATGNIGTQAVVTAAPDGYTILLQTSAVTINPWLSKQPFDVLTDLAPVTRPAISPYALVVNKDLPARDLESFIALAKARQGKLTCATYGIGSPPHLALEMIKQAAGIDIVHTPYRGFVQAAPDILSGQLDAAIDTPSNVLPHVRSGAIRVLGVTSAKPMDLYPTATPIGKVYPDTVVEGWQGIFAPAKTPAAIVARLQTEFARAILHPESVAKFKSMAFEPLADSTENFAKVIAADHAKFGALIKARGIRA